MAETNKNMTFDVNLLPISSGDHNLGSSNLKWNLFVNQINGAAPVTGVKGNSESSYRTGQVNLTAANIGAAASSHTHSPGDIVRGNYSSVGTLDPLTQALIGSAASNKTFNLPANAITIEYSTDGGSTWLNYNATDTQKKDLFSETRKSHFYLGKNSTAGSSNTINNRLRVTIEPVDRYVFVNGLYIWMSTNGSTVKVDLERSTIGAKDTYTTVFTDQPLAGWSGNNIRYFASAPFGGGSAQTTNYYKYRLIFKQTAVNTNYGSADIYDIRFLGMDVHSSQNSMVSTNHLYKWDADLNATFPAGITATSFSGSGASLTNLNASNLSSGTVPIARIQDASTSQKGVVQLSSATDSTSTSLAATASAVKAAYDLAASKTSLTLGTTSSTAYRGDYGNTAYTHATDSSRLTTAQNSGFYKIAITAQGHIAEVTAVTKADITGLLGLTPTANTGTVTSIAASGSGGISISGSPITTSGTIAIGLNLSTAINGLGEGASQATGEDYLVAQYAGGGTTTTTYHRRKVSNVVNATVVKAALNTNATHSNQFLRKDGTWQVPIDTKNTAGSTNSTSKLFLIGATSQAANPTTNSYQYTYTTNGLLSSTQLGLNVSGTEKVHMEWNATDQSIDFVFD